MEEKSIGEYLAAQEAELQKKSEKAEKRKMRFKKKLKIFSIIFAAFVIIFFIINLFTKDSLYNKLKDAKVTDAEAIAKIAGSDEAIVYPDLFDKYEAGYLGNKSMNSMNYGLIAENQYGYTSINENNEVVLHTKDNENIIATEQISQINIAKDLVIFRGADKKLYTCKHDGSDKKAIVDDKVGTVLLVGDDVYYVNYSKANNLYKYNMKNKKSKLVVKDDVKNFTIAADEILYLDYNNSLVLQTVGFTTPTWTNSDVAKFYFNGDIYVQNNDKVIKFNLNNHFPEDVATGISELLGVDEQNVYYSVKGKLYSQNLSSGKKKELPYEFDYFKGVYSVNDTVIAFGGENK